MMKIRLTVFLPTILLFLCDIGIADWFIECVDGSGSVGLNPAIDVDSSNYPHIAYPREGYGIKYARWDGSVWQIEWVYPSPLYINLAWTSLFVDESAIPHITFSGSDLELRYATSTSPGSWDILSVITGGMWSSVALGITGEPAVSFNNYFSDDLYFASWNGSGWIVEAVDTYYDAGEFNSLRMDVDGLPHIAYCGWGVRYAHRDQYGLWLIDEIEYDAGSQYRSTSLALDSAGDPHISYHTGSEVRYAFWTGSDWQIETVDATDSGAFVYGTSIALDIMDRPYIAYCSMDGTDLMYAFNNGTGWQADSIYEITSIGLGDPDLVLDGLGSPHIAFCSGSWDLMYAYNDDTTGIMVENESIGIASLSIRPNPFQSSLSITYSLPEPSPVDLTVYDLSGRMIERLEIGSSPSGEHTITWNPDPALPDGCYLIVLGACGERAVRRTVLLQ